MSLGDVARRAGVSITTASHSFSNRRPVSPDTKRRVWAAALELGFTRPTAKGSIAVLMRPPEAMSAWSFGTTSFADLAGAISTAALSRGHPVVMARDLEEVRGAVPRLDGCILLWPNRHDDTLRQVVASGTPVVSFDPDPGVSGFRSWVGADYEVSIRELLAHLTRDGRERVAAVVGQTDNAYRRAITACYLEVLSHLGQGPLLRVVDNDTGQRGAERQVAELLRTARPPHAVITSSSVFARGALNAALAAGLSVPGDMAVATVTDGPLAEFAPVPITGLRIDTHTSAARLMNLLEARIGRRAPEPEASALVPLVLVRRLSTG
ncbi:LacI family DNA-binding transcriptional regulator [Streptomyces olivaceus]|uniref:LacI family DNA-binding transcriptional regulator n=1 Tax=Streptomyces olivaceus TaxID=47716 RepID=UPI00248FAC38|nr:LacI family DNA-binding transcriptional regulator [Streptomyces olivaceus]